MTFICSSLEPGRDGVGDYTRRLADSLVRQGHHAQLIALNDRHVVETAADDGGEGDISHAIRIPASSPWRKRVRRVRGEIDAFAPDWISIQFVAYGFDTRGLVWRLGDRLHAIAGSIPVHLIFHELWHGDGGGGSIRRRVEGGLQKRLILRMAHQLRPSVVHTQASPYVALLRKNGIAATRLPLFGNIPIDLSTDHRWVGDAFAEAGLPALSERRHDFWLFGVFGTLHPEWTPEPLLSRIRAAAAAHGKRPALMAIGRLGAAGEAIWSDLGRTHGELPRVRSGEQPADRISQALQALDFGIAASPLALVGKSSTVATMLDHGLPVIVSRNDVSFSCEWDAVELSEPLLIPLSDDLTGPLAGARRRAPRDTVDAVAGQFAASLEASTVCGS